MNLKISVVGSGIVGLVTATIIKNVLPDTIIEIYDADEDPTYAKGLIGTTFGQGRDARHFTGSESLSFQNPIHSRALRLAPGEHKNWAGWRLIPEGKLTKNERRWRSESTYRFIKLGHENINIYDFFHAQINYAGMMGWDMLSERLPHIQQYKISSGPVSVFFLSKQNFEDDLASEKSFLQRFGWANEKVKILLTEKYGTHFRKFVNEGLFYNKALQLAGASWNIRSLGLRLLADLKEQGVLFHWNKQVINDSELESDVIIWTAGTTHALPLLYRKFALIQGLAGCWVSIPNPGFTKPFKISLPQPSGYINCTPDHELMHISGGFGWVGEKTYHDAVKKMGPISQHFKEQIAQYFNLNMADINKSGRFPISICIRPSSPTGLPDVRTTVFNKKKQIILTGSGKSGSTQAPLLALYALEKIHAKSTIPLLHNVYLKKALRVLNSLSKIHTYGESTDYPKELEKDLFG